MSKAMKLTNLSKRARAKAPPEPVETIAPAPAPMRPQPSARALAAGLEAQERGRARRQRVQVAANPGGPSLARSPHTDEALFSAALLDACGTTSPDFADRIIDQLAVAMIREGRDPVASLNAGLAVLAGIRPENETEAMLAAQMAATNEAALSMLAIAKRERTPGAIQAAGGLAVKLLRTYTAQVEAMDRLRRRGEQIVRVEHVHVHSGAQAIVGQVAIAPGGGGVSGAIQHRPHELSALSYAPQPPLWSEEPGREAVPGPGGEREAAVPAPRRRPGKRRTPR